VFLECLQQCSFGAENYFTHVIFENDIFLDCGQLCKTLFDIVVIVAVVLLSL
jgi:hypothetical protein